VRAVGTAHAALIALSQMASSSASIAGEQTNLLNQLYKHMWLYFNFFQPVMRLKEKMVVPQRCRHARIRRRL